MYGHVDGLARTMKKGVDSVDGVEGVLYRVPETLSSDVLQQMKAPPKDDSVPEILASELVEADGVLFGFPTRFGGMAAQMQAFFDSSGSLWNQQKLAGKPAGFFVSTGTQGGGQGTTAIHMMRSYVTNLCSSMSRAAKIRRAALQRSTGRSLEGLPLSGFDYQSILGQCCEMPVGFVQIPIGIAGPLLLDDHEFSVPMATTEGCLIASTNRGCKAIHLSGVNVGRVHLIGERIDYEGYYSVLSMAIRRDTIISIKKRGHPNQGRPSTKWLYPGAGGSIPSFFIR